MLHGFHLENYKGTVVLKYTACQKCKRVPFFDVQFSLFLKEFNMHLHS